jgi:SAM-dependent methyltransferase
MKIKNSIDVKRQDRRKTTAEDFTPAWLVNQMLDKLNEYGKESWEEGKTFLDPACGNGNMLVEVLKRKLSLKHDPLISIQSVYGVDIMQDNIKECRTRLLTVLQEDGHTITKDMVKAVLKNVVWTPLCRYKNGSLDYDFSFSRCPDQTDVNRWYEQFTNNSIEIDNFDNEKSDNELVKEIEEDTLFNTL